ISGARVGGGAVSTIRSTGKGTMQLDLRHFPFAAAEKNRRVTNAIVLLPGAGAGTVKGHVHLMSPAVDKAFPIIDGVATSNGEPLRLAGSTTRDAPLNVAFGQPVEQI